MSTISTSGIDELVESLGKLSADIQEELVDKMLDAGAEEGIKAWKDGIVAHGHVDTGAMRDSVAVAKGTKKGRIREIYPQGTDKGKKKDRRKKKGVRNAEKAFILHYGTTSIIGDHFVDDIDDIVQVKATKAMEKTYNEYLKSKGLI